MPSVTRKPTHRDKHASALEPWPTASEERHDEDDDTDRNAEAIGADHAVSGEQLRVSCIRESKPDTHTQNTTTTKLKQDKNQFISNLLLLKSSTLSFKDNNKSELYVNIQSLPRSKHTPSRL